MSKILTVISAGVVFFATLSELQADEARSPTASGSIPDVSVSCEGTPEAVQIAIKESPQDFIVGGITRFIPPSEQTSGRTIDTTLILMSRSDCQNGYCVAHIMLTDSSELGCKYVFSTKVHETTNINSSIILNGNAEYSSSCELYFHGYCFRR